MKKILSGALVIVSFLFSITVKAQTDSIATLFNIDAASKFARVYFIRATGHNGGLVNCRLFIDDSLYCKIWNNRYSAHDILPGTHKFYVRTWDDPSVQSFEKLELEMEAGKTYYLRVVNKVRAFEVYLYFDEITFNSAKPLLVKYKKEKNCLR